MTLPDHLSMVEILDITVLQIHYKSANGGMQTDVIEGAESEAQAALMVQEESYKSFGQAGFETLDHYDYGVSSLVTINKERYSNALSYTRYIPANFATMEKPADYVMCGWQRLLDTHLSVQPDPKCILGQLATVHTTLMATELTGDLDSVAGRLKSLGRMRRKKFGEASLAAFTEAYRKDIGPVYDLLHKDRIQGALCFYQHMKGHFAPLQRHETLFLPMTTKIIAARGNGENVVCGLREMSERPLFTGKRACGLTKTC